MNITSKLSARLPIVPHSTARVQRVTFHTPGLKVAEKLTERCLSEPEDCSWMCSSGHLAQDVWVTRTMESKHCGVKAGSGGIEYRDRSRIRNAFFFGLEDAATTPRKRAPSPGACGHMGCPNIPLRSRRKSRTVPPAYRMPKQQGECIVKGIWFYRAHTRFARTL
ncbi:hypothetical protein AG1IA_10129 [Rhizoctonia solani AG-1 IA]|uniref:Uncharacterized protein n=1 Tax=Thanatephorus cucumeris (strain AG1-IA) TaxID=983506 RepID=L8WCF6_THACA|nr:hypothetical protein AG1IA_10129 [Rhizoctonia solani AG-1 IA]